MKDLPAVLVLSCRMVDAGNYNSSSVQDFVRSVLNAVMSLLPYRKIPVISPGLIQFRKEF